MPVSEVGGISQRLTVNARAAGPRLGKDVQTVIKGSKSGDWSVGADGAVTSGGIALAGGGVHPRDRWSTPVATDSRATAALPGGGYVVLDTTRTPELEAEGLARDVVRAVQQARRDAGLDISDRIRLTVAAEGDVWEAVVAHQQLRHERDARHAVRLVRHGRRPCRPATACSRRRSATGSPCGSRSSASTLAPGPARGIRRVRP